MLDHKKEAITELWQFCPKCNIKLYRMTADCTGFIHIKCWRCREMLWLSLLTIPKRKQQVAEILKEAETYIWRIKEEMRCA